MQFIVRASICAVTLTALVWSGQAQDANAPDAQALARDKAIIDEVKSRSQIMKNLSHLSDVIGPRVTGSENLKRANHWTADLMKSYGLSNVRLEPWTIPMGWERGTAVMKIVDPDNGRTLTVASAAWSPGLKEKMVCDVVVMNAKNRTELAEYKGKLKNAVVLRGEPTPIRPVTDLSYGPGGGRRKTPDPKKDPMKEEADPKQPNKVDEKPKEKGGGLDFREIMAVRREMSAFIRSEGAAVILSDAGKPHNLLTMTGEWQTDARPGLPQPIPTLFIAHEHYALLHRLATRPGNPKTRVEVEITNKFIPGPITVYNTVGEIPGEIADEFVVVGAHLDSWDLAQGTTDNGTGSCVVLEAARAIIKSGIKPKRTIRFVLFTGEEQGLHGSKQYVKRHKDELPKTSAALVHDTGTGKVLGFGLQGREVIKPILDRELVSLKALEFTGVTTRSSGGSDHISFEAEGVPGFACDQDIDEYRLTHHTQSDTFDKAKEPNLIQGAQVMAVTAVRIANLPNLLPRDLPPGARPPKKNRDGEQPKKDAEGEQPKKNPAGEPLLIRPRETSPRP